MAIKAKVTAATLKLTKDVRNHWLVEPSLKWYYEKVSLDTDVQQKYAKSITKERNVLRRIQNILCGTKQK